MITNGWDTVFVIAASEVNAAMATHKNDLRMAFDADPRTDPPITATGRYGSWAVVAGGSEKWMYLALNIAEGRLSIGSGTASPLLPEGLPPRAWDATEFDLSGLSVVVAINLLLVPQAGSMKDIKFDIRRAGHAMPPPEAGYVVPVRVLDPMKRLDVASSSLLGFAIADDLVRNAGQVTYLLGNISPVPPGTDSWLSPTSSNFCFIARENGTTSIAVLSMTQGRSADGLALSVDPSALREDMTSSYLVSGSRVLQNMILPILPAAYETGTDTFAYDAAGNRIVNRHAFKTFSVKSGAITYHPEIREFSLRIAEDRLVSSIRGSCDMGIGITMSFSIVTQNQAHFDTSSKRLTFLADNNPVSDSSADIPWYLAFAGPLVIAITEICVRVISKDIASSLNDLLRSALSITQTPPQPIKFTGTGNFDVRQAGLNDSLYLMGSFKS